MNVSRLLMGALSWAGLARAQELSPEQQTALAEATHKNSLRFGGQYLVLGDDACLPFPNHKEFAFNYKNRYGYGQSIMLWVESTPWAESPKFLKDMRICAWGAGSISHPCNGLPENGARYDMPWAIAENMDEIYRLLNTEFVTDAEYGRDAKRLREMVMVEVGIRAGADGLGCDDAMKRIMKHNYRYIRDLVSDQVQILNLKNKYHIREIDDIALYLEKFHLGNNTLRLYREMKRQLEADIRAHVIMMHALDESYLNALQVRCTKRLKYAGKWQHTRTEL